MITQIPDTPIRYADDRLEEFSWHKYQNEVLASTADITLALAGTQSGKTAPGPYWLMQQILERGQGDYMVVAPTYPLLEANPIKVFRILFEDVLKWGNYNEAKKKFFFHPHIEKAIFPDFNPMISSRVIFGHAMRPSSLEAATIKAAWLDECGQPEFKMSSWEAIQRRFSTTGLKVLMTTTPYNWGWLKTEIVDKADGQSIHVINYHSMENPNFDQSEYDRAVNSGMAQWKIDMFYFGRFTRPAGAIYDCFSAADHTMPRREVPRKWERIMGIDFGEVNMAAIYLAAEETPSGKKTGRYWLYRTFAGRQKRSVKEYANAMLTSPDGHQEEYEADGLTAEDIQDEPRTPDAYGGSASEGNWRREFQDNGLYISRPKVKEIGVQINRVYSMINTGKLLVFDDLKSVISDLTSYSHVRGPDGEPTEKIEDKEKYHLLDALRYACSDLGDSSSEMRPIDTVF